MNKKDKKTLFFIAREIRQAAQDWRQERGSPDDPEATQAWVDTISSILSREQRILGRLSRAHSLKADVPHPDYVRLLKKLHQLIKLTESTVWPEKSRIQQLPKAAALRLANAWITCFS